eukprot:3949111-Ditylum_brightwellii.AAC.1
MILNPKKYSGALGIDCFVNSEFSGLWRSEDQSDPESVQSQTGCQVWDDSSGAIALAKMEPDRAIP